MSEWLQIDIEHGTKSLQGKSRQKVILRRARASSWPRWQISTPNSACPNKEEEISPYNLINSLGILYAEIFFYDHLASGTCLLSVLVFLYLFSTCWTNYAKYPLKGLPWGSAVKNPPASVGDAISIPGSGTSSGGGNGTSLQYSCLKNSMDRGV